VNCPQSNHGKYPIDVSIFGGLPSNGEYCGGGGDDGNTRWTEQCKNNCCNDQRAWCGDTALPEKCLTDRGC